MKPLTYDEFLELPTGTLIRITPTERGIKRWRGEAEEYLDAIQSGALVVYFYDGVHMAAKIPGSSDGSGWELIEYDFGRDSNVYLVLQECCYCGGSTEPWKNSAVCTECFRVQK